jgi:hypothetical protein
MTTETPASTVNTDEAQATPITVTSREPATSPASEYDNARRREEQWRTAQLFTALVTPIIGMIAVIFNLMGSNTYANISGALAIITGTAAALIAVEMWRLHRSAAAD